VDVEGREEARIEEILGQERSRKTVIEGEWTYGSRRYRLSLGSKMEEKYSNFLGCSRYTCGRTSSAERAFFLSVEVPGTAEKAHGDRRRKINNQRGSQQPNNL